MCPHTSLSISLTEFLILLLLTLSLAHRHIPIPELQRAAKEVCGIPPMEVTQELLMSEATAQQDQGSSEGLQLVVYG
jgi:hypothetical protein